jgi:hypothetical protein
MCEGHFRFRWPTIGFTSFMTVIQLVSFLVLQLGGRFVYAMIRRLLLGSRCSSELEAERVRPDWSHPLVT